MVRCSYHSVQPCFGMASLALLALCCLLDVVLAGVVTPVPADVTYRIGGLAISGTDAFLASFWPTFSTYLNETVGVVFPGVGFVAVPLAFDDVWDATSAASVDFLFLNPSYATCMESEFGASAILSLRNFRKGNELNQFGGVVITAANRTDITEIEDLKDKIVEGVSITGLGAFQLQWGMVQDVGFNLMAEPAEVRLAYNQKKIVYDVIDGNADVGFVRTDMVERMDAAGEANISDVRFLFSREDAAALEFPFPVATDFVPEWPLQALPHVPADLLKEVVRALLLLNQTSEAATSGKYSAWDAPLSYSYLSALLGQLGVLDSGERRCIQSENVYGAVVCPEGYFKIPEAVFDSKCADLGRGTCPDGYTCLCRPCELLPEAQFSYSLSVSGESVGTGDCTRMTTCATGVLAFSNITLRVVDNWASARETLGLNYTNTLEVHLVNAGYAEACYAAGHGRFSCEESASNGGLGAPLLNVTQSAGQRWEQNMTFPVGAAGSTLLRIIIDGQDSEGSPTLVAVDEPSCRDVVFEYHVSSCNNNGSRSMYFDFKNDSLEDLCGRFVEVPATVRNLECDYAPWGSSAGIATIALGTSVTVVAVAITAWTVAYRKTKAMMAAQWRLCIVFSSSVAVVSMGVVAAAGPRTNFTCVVEPLTFYLGICAAVSSLFVKAWRVRMVWKAGMQRVKIKTGLLFR